MGVWGSFEYFFSSKRGGGMKKSKDGCEFSLHLADILSSLKNKCSKWNQIYNCHMTRGSAKEWKKKNCRKLRGKKARGTIELNKKGDTQLGLFSAPIHVSNKRRQEVIRTALQSHGKTTKSIVELSVAA